MQQELISLASGAVKNTHCTVDLSGWPAVVAVIGLGVVAGLTMAGVAYINANATSTSYESYDA